jgi:TolA-binding protein
VEVPVEVIKEVEVIREVIVEVPVTNTVEKIIEVGKPNDKTKLLQETLQKLRKELSEKNSTIKELEEINKRMESVRAEQGAIFLKGSNIRETM